MPTNEINFLIRPNKNIERKLMIEIVQSLAQHISLPITNYQYIGMGSYWFADFVLFHKRLSIQKMVSMERERKAARARFNKPIRCIDVIGGDSTQILPELHIGENDSIVWLDYDGQLDCPVFEDIPIVLNQLARRNFLFVTVNSNNRQLESTESLELAVKSLLALGVPENLIPKDVDVRDFSRSRFPILVNRMLLAFCTHQARQNANGWKFYPLFSFTYADNAPMSSVGGILIEDEDEGRFQDWSATNDLNFQRGTEVFNIEAPLLTLREKLYLDRNSPFEDPIQDHARRINRYLKFKLNAQALEAYREFYKHYPMFGEFEL